MSVFSRIGRDTGYSSARPNEVTVATSKKSAGSRVPYQMMGLKTENPHLRGVLFTF